MQKINSENDLRIAFNKLCDKAKKENWQNLEKMTNSELLIFIAGKTLNHGRNWKDSIENAKYHLENPKKARLQFSTKTIDIF